MADSFSAISSSSENGFERHRRAKDDFSATVAADNQVGGVEIQTLRSNGSSALSDSLPSLDLFLDDSNPCEQSGWLDVAYEVGAGMVDEVIDHPGRVALNAAIGVGVGVAAALVAPEVAIVASVAGLAYGAYEIYENVGGWFHDADVVANQEEHTKAEVVAAKAGLNEFGMGLTDVIAGAAGASFGSVRTIAHMNFEFVNAPCWSMPHEPIYDIGFPLTTAVIADLLPVGAVSWVMSY